MTRPSSAGCNPLEPSWVTTALPVKRPRDYYNEREGRFYVVGQGVREEAGRRMDGGGVKEVVVGGRGRLKMRLGGTVKERGDRRRWSIVVVAGEVVLESAVGRCSLGKGDVAVVPAKTDFTLHAVDIYTEIVYLHEDSHTPNTLSKEHITQREYVSALRRELHLSQELCLLADSTFQAVQNFKKQEYLARLSLELSCINEHETFTRASIISEEEMHYRTVRRLRCERSLLPWCTLKCNYCCSLQHGLFKQIQLMCEREVLVLDRTQEAAAEALLLEEALEWRRMEVDRWSARIQLNTFLVGRELLVKKVKVSRLLVALEEQHESLTLTHQAHEGEEATKFHNDSWNLKNQAREINRLSDLLHLREEGVSKAALKALEERNEAERSFLSAEEAREAAQLHAKISASEVQVQTVRNEAELEAMQNKVNQLLQYKADREADDLKQVRLRIEEEQRMLQAELEIVRKRNKKKKGMAKPVVPQNVIDTEQCDRCRAKVTKQSYFQHIDRECSERPVECKICLMVLRAYAMPEHMSSECPSRNAACEECGVLYQARHLDAHQGLCREVKEAKELLPTLEPTLGVEVSEFNDGEGLRLLHIKPGGSLDGLANEDDIIVSFQGEKAPKVQSLFDMLATCLPGKVVELVIKSSQCVDGPWWGGDIEDLSQYITIHAEVQTDIPLAHYRSLVTTLEDDAKLQALILEQVAGMDPMSQSMVASSGSNKPSRKQRG